jgi:hypothetical protein
VRPAYAAILFFIIGLILLAVARYGSGKSAGHADIAKKVRNRTGGIFLLVAAGLLILDALTRSGAR